MLVTLINNDERNLTMNKRLNLDEVKI